MFQCLRKRGIFAGNPSTGELTRLLSFVGRLSPYGERLREKRNVVSQVLRQDTMRTLRRH